VCGSVGSGKSSLIQALLGRVSLYLESFFNVGNSVFFFLQFLDPPGTPKERVLVMVTRSGKLVFAFTFQCRD
jgi:hypothetical protein